MSPPCFPSGVHWLACHTYLRVTDQLHSTALVGSKASDLTHNAADGRHTLTRDSLLADGPGSEDTAGGRVTTVNTPNET